MYPTTVMPSTAVIQPAKAADITVLPFGTGTSRVLLFTLLAALALVISSPAAADKHGHQNHKRHPHAQHNPRHEHHLNQRNYQHQRDKHHSHASHRSQHSHKPHHVHKPQHGYQATHVHHHPAPPRHKPAQGFSVNIWSLAPSRSNHNHLSASFHYHGQERCYHRH